MSINNLTPNVLKTLSYNGMTESRIDSCCSCSHCNLRLCFELRKKKSCTCSECKQPKKCARLTKKLADKEPYSTNIDETSVKNKINQDEKELFQVTTEAANSTIGNREYATNISKYTNTITPTDNAKSNIAWIKNEINQIKNELCHVITDATNSFTNIYKFTTNVSKDASLTKNVPYPTTLNKNLTINEVNQHEKELSPVINQEENSSIDKRKNTTDISKDISISKNPHATEVNEDLIKYKINELEKEICQVINVDANSSINKRKNIKDISKNISIPKSPNSTKVNEDLIKNEINGIEKEICHVINVEANSSVDKRKNIKDISKNISIPKSPNSTKVNEDLIKNEINDLEKEICQVINVEASSSTDKHKSTKNISNDISNSKNPLSTKVNEDLIKNEINELEKELCHVINKENKLSIDKSNNTTNNSLTDNKPYYTKFNECSIKNEIDQLEKEFRRILSGKQKLFADNSDHKTDIDKDTSLTINEPYPVNEKSKSSCTCIGCKNPKSCPKLKKEVADNKFIPTNINEDSIKLEKELCHVKAKEENSYRNVEKCSKDILNTEGKTDSKNINEASINQRKKDISHVIKKEANSSNDNREYRKYSSKDISLTKDKIAWNIKDKSYTKSSTRQHIHSVAINYKPMDNHFYKEKHLPKEKSFLKETPLPKESTPPKENSIDKENNLPEKSKLSAQVMNLPFNDFRDSLSIENSQTNMSSSNFNKIVKPDFLTKLKEIYNACSCKVCECISGKFLSTNDDTCDCKPCECDECSRMFSKYVRNIKNDLKSVPHSGCPCVSCDRKDCRGVVKNDQYEKNCDCRPCDCVKCWDFPSKPCNCEPCQCTECNALGTPPLRTLIVAPVQGNLQQNLCQCEPCECINCTHNYNAMTSNLRRQVSAEIMTHAICHCERCSNDACQLNSELCRCDMRGQLMMKPNDRASRDYDIHRATVNYTDKKGQFNSHDTIVTYALSSNDYTKPKSYSKSNRDDCQCLDCECMVCEGKRKMLNKCPKRYHDSLNTCKCSYCECDICSKIKVNCFRFKNGYNECDCFDCKHVLHYANKGNNIISAKNSSCKTCYPVKKGKLLTPSMFNGHMSSLSKIPSCISNNKLRKETISMSHFNESANDSFLRKPSDCKNVRACHTESNYKNIDSVYDKKINISDFSELPSKIISSNTHYQSADYIRKVRDGIHQKGNNTVLSKNSADNMQTPDKLCEIFNARKQKPIRDIELLEKYIYLSKMLPKANVESNKSTINSNNASSQMLNNDISGTLDGHRKHVPYLYENMSKEFIYTIPSAGASTEDLNEKQNFNIRHANSSKSIILCDKMSSFITNASHDCGNKFVNTNKINGNNNFQTKYQGSSNINSSNLFGATCNGTYTTDSNVIVDLENGKVNKDLEPEERECFTGNSMTKLSKHNMHKWSKKSKGRKYNKLYSRIMRQIVCAKNITQTYQTNFGPEESAIFASVKKDLSANGNEVESNPHFKENNKRDFAFQNMVWDRPGTLVNKLTSDNILCKNLDTDNQNNKPIDSNTTWPIMRKNLYLSCAEVAESKGICTIPAMEFNIKTTLKSISLQTSDCVNKVETKNGKQALTRLLIEVNNLLNSPLLQSSHSNKSPDLKEESNLSKSKLDLETINRDATLHTHSMFNSVDKETYCDLIRSMEMLQENITNLMNNVLTNAVYKSELLTTKLNMEQGHTQQLPKINLQVDGRPIQKIFSPTRCMAILTCLPHSERLLLTIRTLITSNLPFDHQPAATIVYRPRVKGNAVSSHL
ncbi:uncharacterized protein LOC124543940 isoform X2 [Vanessa cardui]|uniref:uncharacterized protein LOC124543940 isoform X2 n=1 Tax=Vanessa cardui TaxID=171605 RepID=UPI001F133100|nr:uncharacterized protein LOC124543940 isoform X2 [Vanessa cardui]